MLFRVNTILLIAVFVLGSAMTADTRPAHSQDADTANSAPRLTPQRLDAAPSLSGETPRGVQFSPDGAFITYLQGKPDTPLVLDLWRAPIGDSGGAERLVDADALAPERGALAEEEKARRERQRVRSGGIVQYSWDTAGQNILIPLDGDLFVHDIKTRQTRRLTQSEGFEIDARITPAGGYAAFVRDGAVFAVSLANAAETQISPDPTPAVRYGVAEFIAQEEMGRYTGYWWSADDRYVAYTRVDETGVDIIQRFDIGAEGVTVREQRYPRAGTANAVVDLFIRDMQTGDSVQVDLGSDADVYLARANWVGGRLLVQRQNRAQTVLDILSIDPAAGTARTVFTETSQTWVNLHDDLRALDDGAAVLWTSERSGFRHIHVVDTQSGEARAITSGDWTVKRIVGVNTADDIVYFEGFRDTPLENHLYAVGLTDDDEPVRITSPGASWSVAMDASATAFVGMRSTPAQPPQTGLYATDGALIRWIEENAVANPDHPYAPFVAGHVAPEFGVLTAEDGQTLHYAVLKPKGCSADTPCPAILSVYGGPIAQTVTRSWAVAGPTEQMFLDHGFVVFQLDNRGSAHRGVAFERVLHRNLGAAEVRDQILGARHLASLPYVDEDRIGVMGWSYGGYMALLLMTQAPEVFAAGISGAPVTDWALYDTHYTERYLGKPQDEPAAYEAGSVFPYLANLRAPLLMMHGMADDNVTFDNSTRVYEALQDAGVVFETMVYPGERHGIYGPRAHLVASWLDFFQRRLRQPQPGL